MPAKTKSKVALGNCLDDDDEEEGRNTISYNGSYERRQRCLQSIGAFRRRASEGCQQRLGCSACPSFRAWCINAFARCFILIVPVGVIVGIVLIFVLTPKCDPWEVCDSGTMGSSGSG